MKGLKLCRDGSIVEEPQECSSGTLDYLDGARRVLLSKRLSGILRHYPDKYGVKIDSRGWAFINEIVEGLRRTRGFEWVREWHLIGIAKHDPKGRFEVRGSMIRARYGHTIKVEIEPLPGEPPETLYHGTSIDRLSSILKQGLKPMKRLYVHLTSSFEDAVETGRRHGSRVVVLKIDSKCLGREGFSVKRASKTVYVVERVPPKCIIDYTIV